MIMPFQQNSGPSDNTDKTETLLDSETLLSPQGLGFQQHLSLEGDLARTNSLRLGNDLCRWQTEAHRVRLQPLFVPIRLLAQRLLAAHRDWEVLEQMHLDYFSLEVRARPDAELILIECRWAEDVQLQGTGALELRLAEPFGFDVPACVLFFKSRDQTPLNSEAAEDAQQEDAQRRSPEPGGYLENLMRSLEGFLLRVLGAAECGTPTQAETAVEAENAME